MRKLLSLIPVLCFVSLPLIASPVFDLYHDLGVSYAHDCKRTDWLGFYRPGEDKIHLRPKGKYRHAHRLNHTALHELGHWSRHASRLGRPALPNHLEEIMCDAVAAILADELQISREPNDAIAEYVDMQMGSRRLSMKNLQALLDEVHKTVEYLLDRPYSRDSVKGYLRDVRLTSDQKLARLS